MNERAISDELSPADQQPQPPPRPPVLARQVFRVLDFETTGLPRDGEPPENQPVLVEVGHTDVVWTPGLAPIVLEPRAELVNAGRRIPPEASAIHHIRTADVAGARPPALVLAELDAGATMFVAHPIEHERVYYPAADRPWCCIHKCSLRVWQEAPDHKIQTLRYWLGIDDDPAFDRDLAMPPHRAGADSYVGAHVFARLLVEAKLEDMLRWSSGPALLVTCFLPKHRGKRWAQVAEDDRPYLIWIVDKSDLDRDTKATARYWLKKTERT